jgi:hypothetical protein
MTKVVGRPFPKGVSPNPGGRPKQTPTFKAFEAALQEFSQEGAEILIAAIKSGQLTGSELMAALKIVFSYAWGNPKQTIEADIVAEMVHFVARMPLVREESKTWVSENRLSSGSPNPVLKLPT